jgi:hypothetical protein
MEEMTCFEELQGRNSALIIMPEQTKKVTLRYLHFQGCSNISFGSRAPWLSMNYPWL